jgi:Spy/CpxP family protein refolding chaperone
MKYIAAIVLILTTTSGVQSADSQHSSYVGQEHREIKSLSDAEIADLLAGRGMGLAKAAELNGYPGPKHVLELAPQLNLTSDQLAATKKLHHSMQTKASELGRRIAEQEQVLDTMFADKTISHESLSSALETIGELQTRLRRTHLETHLTQAEILTAEQSEHYSKLRGYSKTTTGSHHAH